MSDPTLTPEVLAQAAEEERKRQQDSGGSSSDAAGDIADSMLDGTLSAMVDGALAVGEGAVNVAGAVAEGAVNVIGGILGGLGDLG